MKASAIKNGVNAISDNTQIRSSVCLDAPVPVSATRATLADSLFKLLNLDKGKKDNDFVNMGPEKDGLSSVHEQVPTIWLIYFLLLSIPLILYTLRFLDDNRLVSWYWSISLNQLLIMFAVLSVLMLAVVLAVKIGIYRQCNIAAITLISFFIVVPFWTLPEAIIDNARYFTQAKYVSAYGIAFFLQNWGENIFSWTDMPLIPLIYGVAFKVFGEHRVVIQIITGLFFSATVLLTYLTGKTLWSESHGYLGAVLLLGMPYLYSQIPLMLVDIPTMFLLTLAIYLSILAVNKDGVLIIVAASTAIVLAVFSKYSTWVFLSAIPLVLLSQDKLNCNNAIRRLLLVFGVSLIVVGVIFVAKHEVIIRQIDTLISYQWAALGGWQESNVSTFMFQIHPFIAIAALISIFLAIKNRDRKFLVISGLLIIVILLQIQRIRYLLIVFPMLALMAAYALAAVRSITVRHFVAYGVALSSYVMAFVLCTSFLPLMSANNIKLAGEYLNSTDIDFVEVVVLPQLRSTVNPLITVPALDYHTNKPVIYKQDYSLQQIIVPDSVYRSPVRFTWEFALPQFYKYELSQQTQANAIAIMYSDVKQLNAKALKSLLGGYQLTKKFDSYSKVFKYKTLVNIYLPV